MKQLLMTAGLFAALTACGGGSGTTTLPGTPTDICNGTAVPEFTLVSPAPGATNVAASTSALVFSGTLYNQTGAAESIQLAASNGKSYTLTTFNATSSGYSVPLPTLSAGTTYTVNYVITTSNAAAACASMNNDEGSFTTQ
ncbi:MAG TPA: hypothetical protein VMG98_10165 [Verrucomicrobiae bacterium]|nr:hypothetical protein [Verrucomicrobiae bacterium]